MSEILSVASILAADDRTIETVEVAEWGGSVKVQAFTKRQSSDIRRGAMVGDNVDSDLLEKALFLNGVIEPIFTDEQYNLLMEKSAVAVDKVTKAVMEVSGMSEKAGKEAEANFPS